MISRVFGGCLWKPYSKWQFSEEAAPNGVVSLIVLGAWHALDECLVACRNRGCASRKGSPGYIVLRYQLENVGEMLPTFRP